MDDSDILARIHEMVDADMPRRQMQDNPDQVNDAAERLRDWRNPSICGSASPAPRPSRVAQNQMSHKRRPRQQVEDICSEA